MREIRDATKDLKDVRDLTRIIHEPLSAAWLEEVLKRVEEAEKEQRANERGTACPGPEIPRHVSPRSRSCARSGRGRHPAVPPDGAS